MESVYLSDLRTLHIHRNLIDDLNHFASILDVDVDSLICDAIKMYLYAMGSCTDRILDCVESRNLVNLDKDGNKDLS